MLSPTERLPVTLEVLRGAYDRVAGQLQQRERAKPLRAVILSDTVRHTRCRPCLPHRGRAPPNYWTWVFVCWGGG